MKARIEWDKGEAEINLAEPLDISIPLKAGNENVNAYYAAPMKLEPFRIGNFVGDVRLGGSVNYKNIAFNPHGNGTHTECIGHITAEEFTINQCLKEFFFPAFLISVNPQKFNNGDAVISESELNIDSIPKHTRALIVRTLPNPESKYTTQYSGTNPPYFKHSLIEKLVSRGIEHLLVDLPSLDREEDGGKLSAHKSFWQYPENPRTNATITELIFVPNNIVDGEYLLNLQIAPFENDASPCKPLLFKVYKI